MKNSPADFVSHRTPARRLPIIPMLIACLLLLAVWQSCAPAQATQQSPAAQPYPATGQQANPGAQPFQQPDAPDRIGNQQPYPSTAPVELPRWRDHDNRAAFSPPELQNRQEANQRQLEWSHQQQTGRQPAQNRQDENRPFENRPFESQQPYGTQPFDPQQPYATQSPSGVPGILSGYRTNIPDDVITPEQIEQLKSEIESDTTIARPIVEQAIGQLEEATANLAATQSLTTRAANLIRAAEEVEQTGATIQQSIETIKNDAAVSIDPQWTQELLRQQITLQNAAVDELETKLEKADLEISNRATRLDRLQTQLTEKAAEIADTKSTLDELSDPEDETPVETAARYAIATRFLSNNASSDSISAELSLIEAEDAANIPLLQRSLLELQVAHEGAILSRLEQRLNELRQAEANAAMQEAENQAGDGPPELLDSLQENERLAAVSSNLVSELESATLEFKTQEDRLTRIRRRVADSVRRVDRVGLTASVGEMLRKRKSELPDAGVLQFSTGIVTERLDEVRSERFELEEQKTELGFTTVLDEITRDYPSITSARLKELEPEIQRILDARGKLLGDAINNYSSLSRELDKLETTDSKLTETTSRFRDFINERIFWIRSNDVLFSRIEIEESDRQIADSGRWSRTWQAVLLEIRTSPMLYGLLAMVVAGLFLLRLRFRNEVNTLGVRAARGSCDTFWPTSRTLLLTVLMSLALPTLPLVLGLRFAAIADVTSGSLLPAIGMALLATAWFVIPVELFRRLCSKGGLAQMHFSWTDNVVRTLRNNLLWALPVGALITFSIVLLYTLGPDHKVDLIERLLFVAGMAALTVLLYRCFSPKTGMYSEYLRSNERSWANQTSNIWFWSILAIPLILAVLAIRGFYYTAINLATCVYSTFVFAIVVENLRELLQRFILVRRRHAHITTARRKAKLRREKELEQKKELARERDAEIKRQMLAKPDETPGEVTTEEIARDAIKATEKVAEKNAAEIAIANAAFEKELIESIPAAEIDEDAKRAGKLISMVMLLVWIAGVWLIWSDVLPALRALDNYVVLSGTPAEVVRVESGIAPDTAVTDLSADSEIDPGGGEVQQADVQPGGAQPAPNDTELLLTAGTGMAGGSFPTPQIQRESYGRVTVRDLLVFLLIAGVTLISARNFPGLLEMFFLDSLPVDHSVRNAVKSLTSYAIVILGLVFAFRALSIGWSQVQWLVTALTFGLAFGLQEIFANFVAGIILLFERPVRIGDLITVDNVTGFVSRMRTRATTIISWDRKEYIIPNKDFITGRLLNWTLSDRINRVVIDVGVAYGSDVELAKELLYKVCENHPMIVDDPPTIVTFDKFGDNSLNFCIRTFLPDIDSRLPVIDSMHTAINRAFNEAGIEISFPQRDLHLRSVDETIRDLISGENNAA